MNCKKILISILKPLWPFAMIIIIGLLVLALYAIFAITVGPLILLKEFNLPLWPGFIWVVVMLWLLSWITFYKKPSS